MSLMCLDWCNCLMPQFGDPGTVLYVCVAVRSAQ